MKPYGVVFLCLTYSIWQNILKTHACFLQINSAILFLSPWCWAASFYLAELEGRFKRAPLFPFSPLLPHASGLLQEVLCPSWNSLHTRTLRVWFYLEKNAWNGATRGGGSGPGNLFLFYWRVCSLVWEEKSQIVLYLVYMSQMFQNFTIFVFRVTGCRLVFFLFLISNWQEKKLRLKEKWYGSSLKPHDKHWTQDLVLLYIGSPGILPLFQILFFIPFCPFFLLLCFNKDNFIDLSTK